MGENDVKIRKTNTKPVALRKLGVLLALLVAPLPTGNLASWTVSPVLMQRSPAQWEGNIFRQTHVADQLGSQEVLDEQQCLPNWEGKAAQPFHQP